MTRIEVANVQGLELKSNRLDLTSPPTAGQLLSSLPSLVLPFRLGLGCGPIDGRYRRYLHLVFGLGHHLSRPAMTTTIDDCGLQERE